MDERIPSCYVEYDPKVLGDSDSKEITPERVTQTIRKVYSLAEITYHNPRTHVVIAAVPQDKYQELRLSPGIVKVTPPRKVDFDHSSKR
jgi:hypothetical protein